MRRMEEAFSCVHPTNCTERLETDNLNAEFATTLISKVMQVPTPIWRTLSKDAKKWIIDERRRQLTEEGDKDVKPKPNSSQGQQETKPSELSKQYAKTQQVSNADEIELLADQFLEQALSALEPDDGEDPRNIGNVQTSRVSVDEETVHNVMNSIMLMENQSLAIVDGGVDTTVIGSKGFHIVATDPSRTATIVGYDPNVTKRRELPIVSGITVFDLPTGPLLVMINEAIFNKHAEATILSEFQIREHGMLVDSVAKRHGGNQQITLLTDGQQLKIPLELQPGLMHCKHCLSTSAEIEKVVSGEVIPLAITCGDQQWNPRKFND